MAHLRLSFGDFRLWKGRCILAGVIAALALSAVAHAFGVNVPWEYDFKAYPANFVYLRGDSKIMDDGAGGRMLVNGADYDVFAVFVAMNGKMDQPLRVTVTAACGDGARAKLGLLCLLAAGSVVQSGTETNFGWNRRLNFDAFSDETFDVLIPENLRQKGDSLFLMLYRSNQAGTLKIKKVKIEVAPPQAAPAEPAKPSAAPATPAPEADVFPYSIYPEGTGDSLTLDFFPLGVYCSGEPDDGWVRKAKAEGVDPFTIGDRMYKEIAEMGANAVYFQGTLLAGDGGLLAAKAARLAASHGLKVIAQPNDVFYRGNYPDMIKQAGCKNSWEYFHNITAPRVRQYLPQYGNDPNIWAWSPVEEMHGDPLLEWEVGEYRRLIWEFCPKARVYEVQADVKMMKAMKAPYPNVLGIDRYCFWTQEYGGEMVLWTPNLALQWLRGAIRPFIEQAEQMGRPCVFVMDSVAWYSFVDPSAYPTLKTPEQRARSVPENPTLRYYPKFDKFGYWSFNFAPRNGMRAMCWIGVMEGAKGLFCWNYYGDSQSQFILSDCIAKGVDYYSAMGKGKSCWVDTQKGFAEVKPFGQLLLALHKEPVCGVTVSDPAIWTNTFKDADGRRFAIVVNSHIATWDKTSPATLNFPETKLTVDDNGNMINYEEAPPITFTVTLPSAAGATVQPLCDGAAVKPVGNGYELTLEPGQGVVLYIGKPEEVGAIKTRYGLSEGKP